MKPEPWSLCRIVSGDVARERAAMSSASFTSTASLRRSIAQPTTRVSGVTS